MLKKIVVSPTTFAPSLLVLPYAKALSFGALKVTMRLRRYQSIRSSGGKRDLSLFIHHHHVHCHDAPCVIAIAIFEFG